LQEDNVPIQAIPAKGHKVVRAQRASQAWAEGRIRCLAGAEWVDSFVSELRYFTGDGDVHDDQVDALVSGFDGAEIGRPVGWVASSGFSYGRPVM
jgi:predicted phage terminase large subunit-like protein